MAQDKGSSREDHSAPPKPWVAGHVDSYHANHPAPTQIRGKEAAPEARRGGQDRATAGREE